MNALIKRDRYAMCIWLAVCALLVAAMVLVGGYTRLSGSGLSITSWKPIHGIMPPRNNNDWMEEYEAYRATPQYEKINKGMTLEEFKIIFWPEYFHRLLGRAIGLVFFLPLVIFALRRSLSARLGWRLTGIFALGGLQGLIGWLMVASGLVNDPYVSHLRLALHLGIAFLIFALILWALLDILPLPEGEGRGEGPHLGLHRSSPDGRERSWYLLWFILLCLQLILGAFVAGLHAGLIYNTWPTMNGQWVPDGMFLLNPWYINIIKNIALVQFLHRTLAVILALGFLFWWFSHRVYVRKAHLGKVCTGVTAIIAVQFTLGVATLLYMVPLSLALAHQMTALLLFAMAVMLLHRLSPPNGGVRFAIELNQTRNKCGDKTDYNDDQVRNIFPAEHRPA